MVFSDRIYIYIQICIHIYVCGFLAKFKVIISILNWSALCRVNNDRQQLQSRAVAVITNSDGGSQQVGIVLLPQFGYQRGQLWMQEHHCLKALSSAGLHVDRTFTLPFSARVDQRDNRPLMYHGRIVSSLGLSEKDWALKNSELVRNQRCEPAEQLPASSMVFVEDLQPDAMPCTTDLDGLVSGAKKYEQVGSSGYGRILQSAVAGLNLPPKGGIVVFDASLSVGDCFDAWMDVKNDWQVPTAYVGLPEDMVVAEWFQKTRQQAIARKHMHGDLSIPGCPRVDPELPAEHKTQAPSLPPLNVLQAVGPNKAYPLMPESLIKELVVCFLIVSVTCCPLHLLSCLMDN